MLSDDNRIIQIIASGSMRHMHDRKNYRYSLGWCRTIVGTFPQSRYVEMDTDFEKHPNRYRFGSATDEEYAQRMRDKENLSHKEEIFAAAIISGRTIQQAYEDAYGPHTNWREKAVFLLRRKRIMTRIKEGVRDKLDEKFGGDVLDFIFEQLRKLIESAKSENVKLGALRDLGEWSGEKVQNKQITTGQVRVFSPVDPKEIARIQAEKVETLEESDG